MSDERSTALAQLRPALRDSKRNLETMRRVVGEHADADLVVFPELFLSGYTTSKLEGLALDLGGPEVGAVARLARENPTTVIFGAPERVSGEVVNSAICVDRAGNVAGAYRKTHLFGDERDAFAAGNELLVVDGGSIFTPPSGWHCQKKGHGTLLG
jgi:predicted amidohydrolase